MEILIIVSDDYHMSMSINTTTSSEELKSEVVAEFGGDDSHFELLFEGNVLRDDKKVVDYGIVSYSEIEIVKSKKGIAISELVSKGISLENESFVEAARTGKIDIVTSFLDGFDDNNANSSFLDISPLLAAAAFGHREVIKLLLSRGSNPNFGNNNNETPLLASVLGSHGDCIKTLLSHPDLNINSQRNSDKWTALHCSSAVGQLSITQMLLKAGADVNLVDDIHGTPLYYAAVEGHAEVVECLLKHGAISTITDDNGWSPLHCACDTHNGIVLQLLNSGSEIDKQDNVGCTPLHGAAINGNLADLRVLLNSNANPNLTDIVGWSPYHCALKCTDMSIACHIIKELIKFGADFDISEQEGRTPLHWICESTTA